MVFIALHGGAGENGTLQALLDLAGKPYTGSGVLASALAMNKAMSKRVFEQAGIPTPRWLLVPAATRADAIDTTAVGGCPLVVKPNERGLDGRAHDRDASSAELPEALRLAVESRRTRSLIEEFIAGRELTVAVLGDQALPIVEIRPKSGLYDYESKYTGGQERVLLPGRPAGGRWRASSARAGRCARRVALGCRGVVARRFPARPRTTKPICLEVNTIPGMTPTSLVPMAAKARRHVATTSSCSACSSCAIEGRAGAARRRGEPPSVSHRPEAPGEIHGSHAGSS